MIAAELQPEPQKSTPLGTEPGLRQATGHSCLNLLETEFKELRKEIERRSHEQQLLISGSLVSSAAAAGIAGKFDDLLLVVAAVIPFVMSVFASLWFEHNDVIRMLSAYIRTIYEPAMRSATANPNAGWETYNKRHEAKNPKQTPQFTLWVLAYFLAPSVAATLALSSAAQGKNAVLAVAIIASINACLMFSVCLRWRETKKRNAIALSKSEKDLEWPRL